MFVDDITAQHIENALAASNSALSASNIEIVVPVDEPEQLPLPKEEGPKVSITVKRQTAKNEVVPLVKKVRYQVFLKLL